jgi:hypothetical protein
MIGARKIKRRPRQLGTKPFSFERRWHFSMDEVDAIGELAVGKYGAKPSDLHFEPVRLLVVDDCDVVEIHFHDSPRVLS